ncbi:hypothetical protein [Lactobacillus taiwanensis]|uniref:Uncharacterized protein n=1 Tax=Lactobacillus taiwanensis TaxID=508451 RepID=A0A256L9E0_9LACO|nr:hypothetical protein [Lactobacillus taiwanensis]OYR87157.1 hypothetical protein CBF53_09210 [Lactobacillus taiwanensis]OYR90028.1 hypothetical protein CBF70_10270 [Lactobacillus taiwanensis]OYR92438.1 hypothetical protein CBF59_03845 [Lactobacillus taiwanensis]OYR95340.1 hypothetical protein CBF58_07390 [Lactobacillus taiwanensis]
MKIVDKTKDKKEEQWQLGDVVKNENGDLALVIIGEYGDYYLMAISIKGKEQYSAVANDCWGGYEKIKALQSELPSWHKVNAKLVIE